MAGSIKLIAVGSVFSVIEASAVAGMPAITFTDLAAFRLQSASFFCVVLLLSAAIVRWVWNSFANEFPRLPKLTYGKACSLVLLWGLLFIIVLTMISGARELMTPGAWQKQGATYKLRGSVR